MNIAIVGTGYVGLVTGTCLANTGHIVYCIDINQEKINNLNNGIIPIYEPGLEDLIKENVLNKRLNFTTSYDILPIADVVFSAVGTPPDEDGSADLKYVLAVAKEFGKRVNKRSIFINKSTVPVGTAKKVEKVIKEELKIRGEKIPIDIVSNPEFLKEGSAIEDFLNPDRIVIGVSSDYAKEIMSNVYQAYDSNKIVFTDVPSAEMIKYAANAMLATRISFMNDIANLCDKVGANVQNVAKGIGLDTRIGPKFLNAGCGYGGSCFPKDVKALIKTGEENHYKMKVLKAVEEVNENQKHILINKINKTVKDNIIEVNQIAILGTAFKPNTDDMREATSIVLINDILKSYPNTIITVYDPIALNECKRIMGDNLNIVYCDNIEDAVKNSDIVVVVTEWDSIKNYNLNDLKYNMKGNTIIDGRNIYSRQLMETGYEFNYIAIGI